MDGRDMNGREVTPGSALSYWIKLGFTSFGGPAGQIAMIQHELVDRRAWIDQGTFLRGLNYCMLLPGPEAQQLATYIGWRLHGTWGGVLAGAAFVIPGALLMIFLAWVAAAHGDAAVIAAAFAGIKPVVIAIVAHAVWRIGKRTITTVSAAALAAAAFIAIYFAGLPFPLIVLAAGLIGVVLARNKPAATDDAPETTPETATGGGRRLVVLFTVCIALWAAPVAAIVFIGGETFLDVAALFTTAAFVTFGGAYAVLPYIADAGVVVHGWLTPANMIDGLALAETTPGPLILVTTYVGYFAGWNSTATGLGQGAAAILAAGLATWMTFLPSFLFILAGAPYIERLQSNRLARGALTAITAAVVGVIINLMVFLATAVFLPSTGIAWEAIVGMIISFALLMTGRLSVPALVAIGLAIGIGVHLVPWQFGA